MNDVEENNEDQLIEDVLNETEEPVIEGSIEPEVSTEESTEQVSTWNAQDYSMNVSGNQILPDSKEHLVNLAQMGHSYSDNMQKLNEERRVMNEENAPLQQYKQMDELFKTNPEFQNHIANAINEFKTNSQMGEETPAYVQQLLQRVENVESYKKNLEEKNADQILLDELGKVKSQYPDAKWDLDDGQGTFTHRLLKHAYDNNINSLNSAYRDLMFDNVAINAKAEALKVEEQAKQAKIKAGKIGSSTNTGGELKNLSYNKDLSYNDLMQKALEMVQ